MSNDEQQTGRQVDGHTGRQTGEKARRDAGREADKGNKADRQIVRWEGLKGGIKEKFGRNSKQEALSIFRAPLAFRRRLMSIPCCCLAREYTCVSPVFCFFVEGGGACMKETALHIDPVSIRRCF